MRKIFRYALDTFYDMKRSSYSVSSRQFLKKHFICLIDTVARGYAKGLCATISG